MGRITNEMVHYCYELGKKVYQGKLSQPRAKEEVESETGMNIGSANDYIGVIQSMLKGEEYRRTINYYATNYYLDSIRKDFGESKYINAVKAVGKHAKYYATLGYGKQTGLEKLVSKRLAETENNRNDICEKCGYKFSATAKYCRKCGHKLYSN